jgi:hypothetical protein
LEELMEEVGQLCGQSAGDGRELAGGEATEEGGAVGTRRGQLLELGEGGFDVGIEPAAGLDAGAGPGVGGLSV